VRIVRTGHPPETVFTVSGELTSAERAAVDRLGPSAFLRWVEAGRRSRTAT
jgi:hypothetical protein